ncbi:MAG TPA: chloride channel protein [Mucilaginibacter sp.]|jgi:H+/Cl- antiporter ClcA|nr:chloride channel protein [Mucilaginibacter sp.]
MNNINTNRPDSSGIPISPALSDLENNENEHRKNFVQKTRLLRISGLAIMVAAVVCFIASFLVWLINIVTNISFYGAVSASFHSPSANHLGLWVIVIPAIGGVIVGLMALYGSAAIRGHGIPEAMEQILTNKSRIKPSITFLKPISSAIAIGTGGPFGAEGPIIATGGALGSTIGQLFKITSNERKVLLAAGATAGMSAIFGTPIAAVFLAIELLLFEFSPKAILPVALACITGAAGHHVLFDAGAVFPMPDLKTPSNTALAIYSTIGLVTGFLSLGLTKIVYFIEDTFEKLPIHWMWWPAIGGLIVGLIGYFAPHTLGVGYDNIINVLSGTMALAIVIRLCFFKFLSWAIALGSGTSGGTLAPLLTIGGAGGAVIGTLILQWFPNSGINIPMAALVGMSAMFAGASRAYLTSISFAMEATLQSHALLPLLGACTASYLVSFFLMENTIMTEKIARRGVFTPDSFEADPLGKLTVEQVIGNDALVLSGDNTIKDTKDWLKVNNDTANEFVVLDTVGNYTGIINRRDIFIQGLDPEITLNEMTHPGYSFVRGDDTLRHAVELMAKQSAEILPVLTTGGNVTGVLAYRDILSVYKQQFEENEQAQVHISLKRQRLKMLIKGRKLIHMDVRE